MAAVVAVVRRQQRVVDIDLHDASYREMMHRGWLAAGQLGDFMQPAFEMNRTALNARRTHQTRGVLAS
jgi:hypothetical protein